MWMTYLVLFPIPSLYMKKRILFLLALYFMWLPLLAIQKPVFMLYHHALASGCSLIDYLKVITHGLLLDCTIAGYLTTLPLLMTLVSVWLPGSFYRKLLKGYFGIMAVLIAAIFSVDVALYGYWGFRLDATLFFYLQSPGDAMASVPLGQFFAQLLMFAVYAFGIYWVLKRFIVPLFPETQVRKRLGGSLIIILSGGILFIPIRGGVTTSTANVGMVYFSQNQFLNHSAINPCFSLIASLSKQQDFAAQFNFFPEEERKEVMDTLSPHSTRGHKGTNPADADLQQKPLQSLLNTSRPNILIILMESFSANAIGAVGGDSIITPNLNRLSREGVLFTNMYANSFRTDRGIVSVLNGYLAQPTTSIMKYPAKSQTLPSIAKTLTNEGYVADMLYGGDINFTNMQSYFFSSGYSRITADRDFPLTSRLSKWGAHDHLVFNRLLEDMKAEAADTASAENAHPFFQVLQTSSSHEPFEVPYRRLANDRLNAFAYTDSCVGDFVKRFRELPQWKNTVLVLVPDHLGAYPEHLNNLSVDRYQIPLLLIGGAVSEPRRIDIYGSQHDIAATLLAQLSLPHQEFVFSKDMLNPASPHFAFFAVPDAFGMVTPDNQLIFNCEANAVAVDEGSTKGKNLLPGKAYLQKLYDDIAKR